MWRQDTSQPLQVDIFVDAANEPVIRGAIGLQVRVRVCLHISEPRVASRTVALLLCRPMSRQLSSWSVGAFDMSHSVLASPLRPSHGQHSTSVSWCYYVRSSCSSASCRPIALPPTCPNYAPHLCNMLSRYPVRTQPQLLHITPVLPRVPHLDPKPYICACSRSMLMRRLHLSSRFASTAAACRPGLRCRRATILVSYTRQLSRQARRWRALPAVRDHSRKTTRAVCAPGVRRGRLVRLRRRGGDCRWPRRRPHH